LYFKPKPTVDDYIFKGRYKMLSYELLVNPADEKKRTNSIKFILQLAEKITNNPTNPIYLRNDINSNEIVLSVAKEKKSIEQLLTINQESWIPISYLEKYEVQKQYAHAGVYIQWNKSKNVYYVGQAKNITQRLKSEYKPEMLGDDLVFVGIETARLDDKEREYIQLLKNNGYVLINKTKGNNPYN
jgi:excinuclease UvrABC nuclease subunit